MGERRPFTQLEPVREHWAVRMLHCTHVLKGTEGVDWKTIAGTAKAVVESPALETLPIMEYVWERTNRVTVNEKLLQ